MNKYKGLKPVKTFGCLTILSHFLVLISFQAQAMICRISAAKRIHEIPILQMPTLSPEVVERIVSSAEQNPKESRFFLLSQLMADSKYKKEYLAHSPEEILQKISRLEKEDPSLMLSIKKALNAFFMRWVSLHLHREVELVEVRINQSVSGREKILHHDIIVDGDGNSRDVMFVNGAGMGTWVGNRKFAVLEKMMGIDYVEMTTTPMVPDEFMQDLNAHAFPLHALYQLQPGEFVIEKTLSAAQASLLKTIEDVPEIFHKGPDYVANQDGDRIFFRVTLKPENVLN